MNEDTHLTPIKAIRLKCLDCCCGQANEVRLCPIESCSLWKFRFGKNPNRKGKVMTEEEKEKLRERFRSASLPKNTGDSVEED